MAKAAIAIPTMTFRWRRIMFPPSSGIIRSRFRVGPDATRACRASHLDSNCIHD
jgi:hypothetical protein